MDGQSEGARMVRRLAGELGFALCGVAAARRTDYGPQLRAWLAAGRQGEMAWLGRNVEVREDPAELLAGARSVICAADYIGRAEPELGTRNSQRGTRSAELAARNSEPERPERLPGAGAGVGAVFGRVARYAQVTDYHRVIKKRLHRLADALRERWPDERFRVCVDTAPVLEREHAMRAGIGWVGKHTLLLNRELGSHLLLGEIVTTLALAPDEPETDHCGTCRRCIEACPTGCITPYSVDASRCISYLTIEHRGPIGREFFEPMGDWVFGCDVCQEVCPFVRRAPAPDPPKVDGRGPSGGPPAVYDRHDGWLDVLEVLGWSEVDRRAAFTRSAMKRAKLHQMKRNALIVAYNRLREADDSALRGRVERIATDEEEAEVVRQTARAVLEALSAASGARG